MRYSRRARREGEAHFEKTTHPVRARCPHCAHPMMNAPETDRKEPRRPAPGDFSICCNCAKVATFDNGGRLHKPTAGQMASFMLNEQAVYMLAQAQQVLIRCGRLPRPEES